MVNSLEMVTELCSPPYDADPGGSLRFAVYFGHTKVVRALLACPRTDLESRDRGGKTALDYAVSDDIRGMIQAAIAQRRQQSGG
jgi:hypothetical protein